MTPNEAIASVTSLCAAIIAAIGAYRKCKRVYDARKAARDRRREREALIDEAIQLIPSIHSELKPNGGSSLADRIRRIEEQGVINATRQRLLLREDERPMFYADKDGCVSRITQAYADLVGRPAESILEDGWKTHVSVLDRRKVSDEWAAAVDEEREFVMQMEMVNSSSRRRFQVEVIAYPAKTLQGDLVGYVGIVQPLEAGG